MNRILALQNIQPTGIEMMGGVLENANSTCSFYQCSGCSSYSDSGCKPTYLMVIAV
jgi:hypothetical protein